MMPSSCCWAGSGRTGVARILRPSGWFLETEVRKAEHPRALACSGGDRPYGFRNVVLSRFFASTLLAVQLVLRLASRAEARGAPSGQFQAGAPDSQTTSASTACSPNERHRDAVVPVAHVAVASWIAHWRSAVPSRRFRDLSHIAPP
jgi:hypothetical protein